MKKIFLMAALVASMFVSQSQAATLLVSTTGFDATYDSTTQTLHDAGSAVGGNGDSTEADSLSSMAFSIISGPFLGILTTNIFVDFSLQLDSALTIGSTSNVSGGFFDLLTSTNVPGYGLGIDVTGGTVEATASNLILSISGTLQGSPCPTCANTFNLGGPITITFSSQTEDFGGVAPEDLEGTVLGDFTSSGSADVSGTFIPEPSTYAMLGSALIGLGYLRRRKA